VGADHHSYCIYILGSLSGTLYIGVTGNLHRHIFQHKFEPYEGFAKQYGLARLVYWESYDSVQKAIRREKQLRVASEQESRADRVEESALGGPCTRVVSVDESLPLSQ
jgi:putative endonuclease